MVLLMDCGENQAPDVPDSNTAFILSATASTVSSNVELCPLYSSAPLHK